MKEVTYIVQCPHCLYDEEQIFILAWLKGKIQALNAQIAKKNI